MEGAVPGDFEGIALDAHPLLIQTSSDVAASDAAAYVVCAVARSHDAAQYHGEVGDQLYEAANRLAAEDRRDWAVFAASWWLRSVAYLSDWGRARERTLGLLEQFPWLEERPVVSACAAAAASIASDDETAARWWKTALEPRTGVSADELANVQIEQARCHLIPRGTNLRDAVHELQSARNHFLGTESQMGFQLFHASSMNLGLALILLGRHFEALHQLREDVRRCPHRGEYGAYLEAFLALAAAWSGEFEEAEESIQRADLHRAAYPGLDLVAIGPARLLLCAHRRDAGRMQSEIARLLRVEGTRSTPAGYRAYWRWVAGVACDRLDLGAKASWLAEESLSLSSKPSLPLFEMRARMLAFKLGEGLPLEHAGRTIELALENGYEELMATAEGVGLAWRVAMNDREGWADHRLVLQACDAAVLQRSARDLADCEWFDEERARTMLDELGVAIPIDGSRADALKIRLFGQFELVAPTGPVAKHQWYGRKRARVLLARLAVTDGMAVHRDVLADDLWNGERGPGVAKRLAPLVWTIRNVLRQVVNREAETLLRVSSGSYRLALGDEDECDVLQFSAAARTCLGSDQPDEVTLHGAKAISLYRGEFLAGEGFDDWIVNTRVELASRYAEVVRHLIRVTGRIPDSLSVGRHLKSALRDDPTNQVVAAALVSVYGIVGDPGQATRTFHATRAALAQLGLPPSTELTGIHQEIVAAGGIEPPV